MDTQTPASGNVIRMTSVDASPCEQIPDGVILGKIECPWFEEPIGWMVQGPEPIPIGKRTRKKPRMLWSFLPTCGLETTLSGYRSERTLLAAVRKQYRRIYDREPCEQRKLFARGDDCQIESLIMEKCGLHDIWSDNDLTDDYSFFHDVLWDCDSAYCRDREWEGGGPGLSGVWYYVYSDNPSRFIREARLIIERLLAEKKAKPLPPPPPPKRSRATIRKEKKLATNLTLPFNDGLDGPSDDTVRA